jgi:iron complex outermembrane recepter protein
MKFALVLLFFFCLLETQAFSRQIYPIRGSVVDSADGAPVKQAFVKIVPGLDSAYTDENGAFEFAGRPNGTYSFEVTAAGYVTVTVRHSFPGPEFTIELQRMTFQLQPILVTAQIAQARRSPVTFSNLTQKTIKDQYVAQDVPVLLSQLPSITQYSENGEGIGYSYITMRGFDQRRISIMINGIPQNDPEDHNVYWIDAPDLQASAQTIQVQRGAGNEFYGAPAIGGSINLETTNLGSERQLSLSYAYGSTGESNGGALASRIFGTGITRRYSATFGSGLVDGKYTFYAHLARNMTDGYRNDSWVDLNSYFASATRYDKDVITTINIYGGPIADGLSYLGLPKFAALDRNLRTSNWADWNSDSNWVNYSPNMTRFISAAKGDTVYAVPRRTSEIENFSQPHFELLNEWKVSPSLTFNNSLFMILGSGFYDYDGSWADTNYFRISSQYGFHPTANPTDALIHAYVGMRQYGWIPRVTLLHERGTLVLGAELDRNISDHWATIRWAQNLPADLPAGYRYNEWQAQTDVAALYGHELYNLTPKATLMLDLEYQFKQYDLFGEKFLGTHFVVPYHFLNPRVGLNYNFNSVSNMYASVSRTSREPQLASLYNADESSGGEIPHFALNPDSTYNFGKPLITPETLNDFELGYSFTRTNFRAAITTYWMEFYNELVSNGLLDQYGQPITGNAKRTRHVGIELEASAAPIPHFSLYGNVTWSRNKLIEYTSFTDTAGNAIPAGISLDGNRISGFPELLGNLRVTYTTNGFSASLLGQYVGSQFTDNFNLASRTVDPYFVANAWISYKFDRFLSGSQADFTLYVNNLLDRIYIAHGEGIFFFPAATRNFVLSCTINL